MRASETTVRSARQSDQRCPRKRDGWHSEKEGSRNSYGVKTMAQPPYRRADLGDVESDARFLLPRFLIPAVPSRH